EGGWCIYPGGPAELSASVKAYFALKLTGHDPDAEYMRRAGEVIRANGGANRCNSFTRFYLALLGQMPYANFPPVPPQFTLLLPRNVTLRRGWAHTNPSAMPGWTRTIVVPPTILYAFKPVRGLPAELGIGELFLQPPESERWPHPPTAKWLSWTNFFLVADW